MNAVVAEAIAEAKAPLTVSEIMAKLFKIRRIRKRISDRDSVMVAEWERLEEILLGKMSEQGSVRVSSKLGTASISEQTLPIVEDWDAFYDWLWENRAFHLLQRRVAVGAYRELIDADKAAHSGEEEAERPPVVPGTRPITKKSINLRAGT